MTVTFANISFADIPCTEVYTTGTLPVSGSSTKNQTILTNPIRRKAFYIAVSCAASDVITLTTYDPKILKIENISGMNNGCYGAETRWATYATFGATTIKPGTAGLSCISGVCVVK